MRDLADAWSWYQSNRRLVHLMERLGRRYWEQMPWKEMERDDYFRTLEGPEVEATARGVLAELDDIAIFVFFSAFEARVRDHVLESVKGEVATLKHPALRRTAARMQDNIEEGSFYLNVLELFKDLDHTLIEEVSQVRKYRNWVAHGRRPGEKPLTLMPADAFERLEKFLGLIGESPPA